MCWTKMVDSIRKIFTVTMFTVVYLFCRLGYIFRMQKKLITSKINKNSRVSQKFMCFTIYIVD